MSPASYTPPAAAGGGGGGGGGGAGVALWDPDTAYEAGALVIHGQHLFRAPVAMAAGVRPRSIFPIVRQIRVRRAMTAGHDIFSALTAISPSGDIGGVRHVYYLVCAAPITYGITDLTGASIGCSVFYMSGSVETGANLSNSGTNGVERTAPIAAGTWAVMPNLATSPGDVPHHYRLRVVSGAEHVTEFWQPVSAPYDVS